MDNDARQLSNSLAEALHQEEYHRDQLLYWKARRLALEQQIPHGKTWLEIIDVLERSTGDQLTTC